jgi:hypothetical protein
LGRGARGDDHGVEEGGKAGVEIVLTEIMR